MFHCQFITYIFNVSLKFRACYITGQWDEFPVKNASYYLHTLSWHFFCYCSCCCCFSSKNLCFYHFHLFFLISIHNKILTNQKPEWVIRNCQWKCMYKLPSLFMCHIYLISGYNNSS